MSGWDVLGWVLAFLACAAAAFAWWNIIRVERAMREFKKRRDARLR